MREKKTMKNEKIKPLDPDELLLDKRYVAGIMKLIEKRWKANGTNMRFIIGLKAFRFALRACPDEIFKTFWKQILQFINMLLYQNAMQQARSRGEVWVDVLEKIPQQIDMGTFDLKKSALEKE